MDDIRFNPNKEGEGQTPQNPQSMGDVRAMNQKLSDEPRTPQIPPADRQIESDPHEDTVVSSEYQAIDETKLSQTSSGQAEELSGGALFFDRVLKIAIGLVVFLTPLFYLFSSNTIEVSKGLLLSTLALIILLCWVGKIISTGTVQYRKTWLVWPAVAVGVIVFISAFFSPSFWTSFLGDIGRTSFSVVSILSYLIIFIVALENLNKKEALWGVLAMAGSVALVTLLSILQFLEAFILPGSFTNNNLFTPVGSIFALALVAAFTIPIVMELFIASRRMPIKVALGIIGLLQIFVVMIINFRTVWITLAISLLLYLALISFKEGFFSSDWKKQSRITIPLIILVIAVLFSLLPGIPGPRLVNMPTEVSPSYGASIDVLKGAWSENALLGSGPEAFVYSYSMYKSPELNQTDFWGVNFNGANAEIITWLVNLGILGALAWLAFVLGFIFLAFKVLKSSENPFLQVGILGSWVFILVSKFFYQTPLSLEVFFWLLPALYLVRAGNALEPFKLRWYEFKARSLVTLVAFILSIVILIGSIGGLYLVAQQWVAEASYAAAFTNDGTPETRDALIQDMVSAVNLNPREARYHRAFSQVLIAKVNDIAATVNAREPAQRQATEEETIQIQNLTIQALNTLQQAQRLDPDNVGLLIDIAESYRIMNSYVGGANDLAVMTYERAVELEPINPFLKTQLAQLYLVQEDFFLNRQVRDTELITKAKEQLDMAMSLNPNYSNARYFMGFIQDRQGDRAGALENFKIVAGLNPEDQVIQVIVTNLQAGLPALGLPPDEDLQEPLTSGDSTQGIPAEN